MTAKQKPSCFRAVAALVALLLPQAVGAQQPPACGAPLKPAVEVDLYFGRVSESDWNSFLSAEVTPRFPDGLSVVDVAGQYRGSNGTIARERSKLLIVVVFDPPAQGPKVQAIIDAYKNRFHQESVLRVEHGVCASL